MTETVRRDGGAVRYPPVVLVSHGFQMNYERGFCNGLAANGADVTLISSDRSDAAGLHANITAVNLRGSQEESRPHWQKAVNLLRYHTTLMAYAVRRRRDVIHVIGLITPLLWRGLVEGLWFRLVAWRYVLTVHDLLPHDRHDPLTRWLCRQCYRLPHKLVVHTERMAQRLVGEFGVPAHRVFVMEHGIEPAVGAGVPAGNIVASAVPTLLAFGGVTRRKGIDLLLAALRAVHFEFRLVIAGQCIDDRYRQLLQALVAAHPYRAWIEWRDGFVPEAEMELLFRTCDVLVLPYRYIDQSGVLFQALRFGLSIVATRVGQFDRYVCPEVGLVAEPEDAGSLATTLEKWVQQRAGFERPQIQQIGRQYEWSVTVRALVGAYR